MGAVPRGGSSEDLHLVPELRDWCILSFSRRLRRVCAGMCCCLLCGYSLLVLLLQRHGLRGLEQRRGQEPGRANTHWYVVFAT